MTGASAGDLVLAVDASTTACKALVFDAHGHVLAEGRSALTLENPGPDAYEQDAEQWWAATQQAIRRAVEAAGAERASRIRALTLTHQRETFVLTDDLGRPLRPALVWMDARCREQVARAGTELGRAHLHELTGKFPCTTPSFYKLAFMLERWPELRNETTRVLDVFAFLCWRLTGRPATSLASADPLGLVDMSARTWSEELLSYLGLDPSNVPELVEPGVVVGALRAELARELGLPGPLPLVASAGDGQAAGLGAGVAAPGSAYLNLGTAIVSGVLSHEYRTHAAFRTLYGATPGSYFLETDLKGGTFTLNWLAEKWLGESANARSVSESLAELEGRAAALPAGADGLLVMPYWNGVMNPFWDDYATGSIIGLHGAHGPAHLYRAILEGIAFEQRLHTLGVERATAPISRFIVMGGGASSRLWCQILADVLDRPLVRAGTNEASALGAAILASVSAGIHETVERAVGKMTRTADEFTPGAARAFYRRAYEDAYAGLYERLRPALDALAGLRTETSRT